MSTDSGETVSNVPTDVNKVRTWTADQVLDQALPQTATVTAGATAVEPISSFDSEFQRDEVASYLASRFDDNLFSSMKQAAGTGELSNCCNGRIDYFSEDDGLFVRTHGFRDADAGDQNVLELQHAYAAETALLATPTRASDPTRFEQGYAFLADPSWYFAGDDLKTAARTGDLTEIARKVDLLQRNARSMADYRLGAVLIDLLTWHNHHVTPDNKESLNPASGVALENLVDKAELDFCLGKASFAFSDCMEDDRPQDLKNTFFEPDGLSTLKDVARPSGEAGTSVVQSVLVAWDTLDMEGQIGFGSSPYFPLLTFMTDRSDGDGGTERSFEKIAVVQAPVSSRQPLYQGIVLDRKIADYQGKY